jgi:hypothetical protein
MIPCAVPVNKRRLRRVSIIAWVQGMRQAGRDWASLLDFIRTSLASHALLAE